MNVITMSWCCHRCGATCISDPPWYGLCDSCLARLQALAMRSLPEAIACPSCGGPVCPDCGDAMPLTIPVPAPATAPPIGQVTGPKAASCTRHPGGGTGDD